MSNLNSHGFPFKAQVCVCVCVYHKNAQHPSLRNTAAGSKQGSNGTCLPQVSSPTLGNAQPILRRSLSSSCGVVLT